MDGRIWFDVKINYNLLYKIKIKYAPVIVIQIYIFKVFFKINSFFQIKKKHILQLQPVVI